MSISNHDNKSQHKDLVFFVSVQYRCNSSWQGTIQWMDGKQEKIFRSALELGKLINDAKNICSDNKQKIEPKWQDKESAS